MPSDEAGAPEPQPLQLVKLTFDGDDKEKHSVDVDEDAIKVLKTNLQATGAQKIAIVSVMGVFRGGKSFLLDLMLRFLRYEEKCRKEGKDPNEGFSPPERGTNSEYPLPPWMSGESLEGQDGQSGFKYKGGLEHCTEGIWIWSEPFLRTIDGEKVALLLMDTQGAWDRKMTQAQSATIFGLTAVLSSKEIYNIKGGTIDTTKVDNLTYFVQFAQDAIQKAAHGLSNVQHEEINRCFQSLDFLVRDWEYFEDDWTVDQCKKQIEDHCEEFTDPEKVNNTDTPKILRAMFKDINAWCTPHPGSACTKKDWSGSLKDLEPDFIRFMHLYIQDVFQTKLSAKKILGSYLSPLSFEPVVKEFVKSFKGAAPAATSFTDAIRTSTVLMAKEKSLRIFQEKLERVASQHLRGMPSEEFVSVADQEAKLIEEDYKKNVTIFGSSEVREDTWKQIEAGMKAIRERGIADNARKLAQALVAFASLSLIGIVLFIGDRVSDYACDWWSHTCVQISKLALLSYLSIGMYVGVHVYFVYQKRGRTQTLCALIEMQQEMVKLTGLYAQLLKNVDFAQLPDISKKLFAGELNADEALKLITKEKAAAHSKKND